MQNDSRVFFRTKTEGAKQIITPPPPLATMRLWVSSTRPSALFFWKIYEHLFMFQREPLCLPVHPTQIKKAPVKILFFNYPTLILIKNKIIQSNIHSENCHAYISGWSKEFENLDCEIFMRFNI